MELLRTQPLYLCLETSHLPIFVLELLQKLTPLGQLGFKFLEPPVSSLKLFPQPRKFFLAFLNLPAELLDSLLPAVELFLQAPLLGQLCFQILGLLAALLKPGLELCQFRLPVLQLLLSGLDLPGQVSDETLPSLQIGNQSLNFFLLPRRPIL